jgi:hypothetical protein
LKKFTPDELAQQPTILVQISGDETLNQGTLDRSATNSVVGLAGDLDSEHPLDFILALPPEHYYEYDPHRGGYIARFYDLGYDSVLGANAIMGHDVYFDIDNSRIGWAESSCDYTALVKQYTSGDWEPSNHDSEEDSSRIEPSSETDDSIGDGPADKYDEPSGSYDDPNTSTTCSGLGCQISVLVGVVAIIAMVADRVVRRAPSGPSYDLAQSELELQTLSDLDDPDEFVNRRATSREFT